MPDVAADPVQDRTVNEVPEPSEASNTSGASATGRFAVVALLVYFVVGTIAFPGWWESAIFDLKILDLTYLKGGIESLPQLISWPVLVASVIISVGLLRWRADVVASGRKLRFALASRAGALTIRVLTLALCASLLTLTDRAELEEAQRMVRQFRAYNADRSKSAKGPRRRGGTFKKVSTPVTFYFIDKPEIDRLYGQIEPDLVPSKVTEEATTKGVLKASVRAADVASADAEKSSSQKTRTEYVHSQRSVERKAVEIVNFLEDKEPGIRFGKTHSSSDSVDAFDDAVTLLTKEHGVKIEGSSLQEAKAKLLKEDLTEVSTRIARVSGFLSVEGEWMVDCTPTECTFSRNVIDGVTSSPICEVRIPRKNLPNGGEELVSTGGRTFVLSVFGRALQGGLSNNRKFVQPIAVFCCRESGSE